VLNVGTKNSKIVALFPAGSWSCGRPLKYRTTWQTVALCTDIVHFCAIDSCLFYRNSPIVPSWSLMEGFVTNVVYNPRVVPRDR